MMSITTQPRMTREEIDALMDFEHVYPDSPVCLQVDRLISSMGNKRGLYFKMLEKLENMSLIPGLNAMKEAVEKDDMACFKLKVHSLKGAASYVGANRLFYICYFI